MSTFSNVPPEYPPAYVAKRSGAPDWLVWLIAFYALLGATGGLWFAIDRIQSW